MRSFDVLNQQATNQYGLLTARQLLDAGYTDRMVAARVREGIFSRPSKGVLRLAGSPESWAQDLLAAVLACEPNAAASHRSASRLWEFRSVDHEVEVSIRHPRRASVEDAIVHSLRDLEPNDITIVDGIPVTTPERTICDLGLIFPEHEVLRILRHAVATKLVTPHDLWNMRQRTSKQGRNGTGVLERVLDALPDQAEQVESGIEVQFLEVCERYNIEPPAIQVPVGIGGRSFRLDFAWTSKRVFVEIDGAAFHSTATQIADDGHRQNLLVQAGWTPLRFTYEDLVQRPGLCARTVVATLGSMSKI